MPWLALAVWASDLTFSGRKTFQTIMNDGTVPARRANFRSSRP
jgi:hypothetical protein